MAKASKKTTAAAGKSQAAETTEMAGADGGRARTIKPQLAPADYWPVGDKQKFLGQHEMNATVMFGTVIGQARGLSYRHNPQDEGKPSIALVGPFKFIPIDESRSEIWSMRAFLPNAVHDTIVTSIENGRAPPVDKSPGRKDKPIDVASGAVMEIVLEVGIKRNESAMGYVYVVNGSNKVPLALQDPLAQLQAKAGMKALPAPK